MSLNDVAEVRSRIAQVEQEDYKYCLMAAYLLDARISEVVAKACPKDTTTARGPKGSDAKLDAFVQLGTEIPCVVFMVKTAKRQGKERYVSLPLDEQYEPWAKPLYGYFLAAGTRPVFNFTRQTIWKYIKDEDTFKALKCPITRYIITDKLTLEKETRPEHNRAFRLQALRHLRASELVGFYGFDGFQLATYGGWTYHTMAQTDRKSVV
jgi:hypothetical protein